MKSNKGYSIIEVLIAMSILVIVTTALLPLSSFITQEKKALSDKRIISNQLHDELQKTLWETSFVSQKVFQKTMHSNEVQFIFVKTEENIIQGCAKWENIRGRDEEVCIYGYQD